MFQDIKDRFLNTFVDSVLVGIELEFYFDNIDANDEKFIVSEINCSLRNIDCCTMTIVKEKSDFQYELQVSHQDDLMALVKGIGLAKELISELAKLFCVNVLFSSKPYLNRSGSGFHVHINLLDVNKDNLFYLTESGLSDCLKYSIGGLCALMKKNMIYFAPYDISYLRYRYPDINTPTTVSWGNNNRTSSIRLINLSNCIGGCRIEHRVSGADCDYGNVIDKIIDSVAFGINYSINPPNQVYGLAGDLQYNLERLPLTIEEAIIENKKS